MKSRADSAAMSSDLTFITNEQGKHLAELVYALHGPTPEEKALVQAAAK